MPDVMGCLQPGVKSPKQSYDSGYNDVHYTDEKMERLRYLFIHQNSCTVLVHPEDPMVNTTAHSLPHGVSILGGELDIYLLIMIIMIIIGRQVLGQGKNGGALRIWLRRT